MRPTYLLACLGILAASAPALAQETLPAPAAPPDAVGQPPPRYPPPYAQPYPYGYPPGAYPPVQQPPAQQQYRLPDRMPYKEGKPIPVGYHVEEVPHKGLVTAGWITTAVPYGIGLFAAVSAEFKNQSGWLAVPFVGPWLMMGRRDYGCDDGNDDAEKGVDCFADVFLVMGLITDGVVQATGGALLLSGYLSTKTVLVRDTEAVRVAPMRVGTGYGLGVNGQF